MEVKAPAKVNLFLNVGNKRKDSYHDIISIMLKISLFDIIKIKEDTELKVEAPAWINPADNLVYKSAKLFFRQSGIKKRCRIILKKNIPAAAGLGGGSSDAATTLKALNTFFKAGLSLKELENSGKKLGSDVNFFLHKGICLSRGRGEDISPIEIKKEKNFHILLIDPGINISTKAVYDKYPGGRLTHEEELIKIIEKCKNLDWPLLLRNDLEETVFNLYPVLKNLKKRLKDLGLFPLLSGSGSCMFALSYDKKQMESAAEAIKLETGFRTYNLTGV